jgi:ferritin-like metal-binding protein YciE
MQINNLRDLFEKELRYIYDCEQKLVKKGLPTMIENSTSPELRNALEQHLQETRRHVERLERVFSVVGADAKADGNDVFDEMADAVEDTVGKIESAPLRDAALIMDGNKVEHYEMAVYGSLVSFAQQLGFQDAAQVLQQTLEEEKAADAKLTQIGESVVNRRATQDLRAG